MFEDEVETFITWVKSAKPRPGVAEVLAPGEPERARKIDREKNGVPIDTTTWQQLIDVARKVRLNDTEIPHTAGPDAPARQETIMAKMKLYYSPASPYARKVRVVAIETKLDKKIEMVNVALSPVAPNADVDKHNPIGKIPALSVKGIDLFDSPVICEYLDNQHKGRKLFPRKGRDRWVALRQQAMADGLLDAALLARYEGALRPEDKRWSDWSQGQMKKINGVLDQLEAEAKSLKGKLTSAPISVACALGYLDFRFAAMRLAQQASQARQVVRQLRPRSRRSRRPCRRRPDRGVMTADEIIARLGLQPHPEGGHYREMFRAPDSPRGAVDGDLLPAQGRRTLALAQGRCRRDLAPLCRRAARVVAERRRPQRAPSPRRHRLRARRAAASRRAARCLAGRPLARPLDPCRLHRGAGLRVQALRAGAAGVGASLTLPHIA